MANTVNLGNNAGINLTVISQETLPVLQKLLPVFTAFTADFSTDAAPVGSTVTTRIATAMTSSLYDAAVGYVPVGVTSSAVNITLGKHFQRTVGFSDIEIQQGGLPILQSTFIQPAVLSVCNDFLADILALSTIANFGSASYSGSTYVFDNFYAGLKDLKNVGAQGSQNVLLNSSYFAKLASDVKTYWNSGNNSVMTSGTISNLAGANVWEVPALPSLSEGLVGFACVPSSIAIAARLPQSPLELGYGSVSNLVEPMSRFPLQLRQWYSMDKGLTLYAATVIGGCVKAQTSGLKRYTDSTGT